MVQWVQSQKLQSKKFHFFWTMLQEKAREISKVLVISEIKASNSWLDKFQSKHSISFKLILGEPDAVDVNITNEWVKHLTNLLSAFSPEKAFNGDETCSGGQSCYRMINNFIVCKYDWRKTDAFSYQYGSQISVFQKDLTLISYLLNG